MGPPYVPGGKASGAVGKVTTPSCLGGTLRAVTQEGPVALGVGSEVKGFLQGPPLVLLFLVDVPLDVLVQQLDGRVERVIGAAPVSL